MVKRGSSYNKNAIGRQPVSLTIIVWMIVRHFKGTWSYELVLQQAPLNLIVRAVLLAYYRTRPWFRTDNGTVCQTLISILNFCPLRSSHRQVPDTDESFKFRATIDHRIFIEPHAVLQMKLFRKCDDRSTTGAGAIQKMHRKSEVPIQCEPQYVSLAHCLSKENA